MAIVTEQQPIFLIQSTTSRLYRGEIVALNYVSHVL